MTPQKYYFVINNSNGCKRRCLNPAWKYYKNKQQNGQSNGDQPNGDQPHGDQPPALAV